MNNRRFCCVFVLLAVLIFPVSASMVSFLVVETGLSEQSPNTQYGSIWEGALMSCFFDAGYIVTSAPIMRMEQKPSQDLTGTVKNGFDEASWGGADFFILGFLNYRRQGVSVSPVDITIRIYGTDSQKLIFEQDFPVGNGRNINEEYRHAQNAGRIIASNIKDG